MLQNIGWKSHIVLTEFRISAEGTENAVFIPQRSCVVWEKRGDLNNQRAAIFHQCAARIFRVCNS